MSTPGFSLTAEISTCRDDHAAYIGERNLQRLRDRDRDRF